ncbi:unnamed protein product [Caenorhabditis angaria]|uniref:Uncharacterized protein n=1 Tax=Caenorhabditis angaria TaxID=860376 RepID=A0A9P1MZR6_9PELO|nr:unnamed protein product [Caenorhabditis angaria]
MWWLRGRVFGGNSADSNDRRDEIDTHRPTFMDTSTPSTTRRAQIAPSSSMMGARQSMVSNHDAFQG